MVATTQLKLYLKILEVSYFLENTNLLIISDVIETVIKKTHISNDIVLVFYSHIIKASPKSDMAIKWVNIWNSQNSMKTKELINRCFNVSHNIITVRGTNMNLKVSQYKNCWKWDHTIFTCHSHSAKCKKCNSFHKLKHHRKMV